MLLAAYEAELTLVLATAVDTSTWTTAIYDEALRLALGDLNPLIAYEVDFNVASTSYTQDLSTVTDVCTILALAYPWVDGGDFGRLLCNWRLNGITGVYFTNVQPTNGQKIRVRYTKLHKIQNLDAAAATTVPTMAERLVLYAAAAWCCILRQRQISENPALPDGAQGSGPQLAEIAKDFRAIYTQLVEQLPPLGMAQFLGPVRDA